MEKTATEIYGPIFNLINQLVNATGDEKIQIEKALQEANTKTLHEFQSFDEEFDKIKNSNLELEDRLQSLNELLDKKMNETSHLDIDESKYACEKIYKPFWNSLDSLSQDYLAMAYYLFRLFSGENNDFSPSVLEYCRAIENELA